MDNPSENGGTRDSRPPAGAPNTEAGASAVSGPGGAALGARLPEGMRFGPLMAVLMLGVFLAILNQTLLNVAIPHMMNEFNVSADTIQWLMTAYMLVNGVLIPISAFLMETFGSKTLFVAAMAFFTVGSLICGVATDFPLMLIGRIVQAVGGGILMPLVMNIFLALFPPEARGRAMGFLGLGMIFAPAVGPTLSGWVVEYYTWRLLFYGMIPLGILVILMGMVYLRDIPRKHRPPLDLYGMVMSILGFGALLYGFSEAGSGGWGQTPVIAGLVIGAIGVFLFVMRELSVAEPMLDFRIFRYDMFALSSLINAIITMALFAGMFLLPIYLQNLRGFTPLQAGLLLLPGALIMGVMSPVSGALFDRIGPRPLAVVGLIITAVTTFEFTKLTTLTSYNHILALYVIRSFGMSLLMMPIMTAGLNQLPMVKNSHGTALSNTVRQVAGAIGTAFLTSMFTTRNDFHLRMYLDPINRYDPFVQQSLQQMVGAASSAGLPPAQAQGLGVAGLYGSLAQQAAVQGIDDAFWWATGFTVLGLLFSFFLRDVRRDRKGAARGPVPADGDLAGESPSGTDPSGPAPSGPAPGRPSQQGPEGPLQPEGGPA
ncbi:DHA2 family efflux MFS transporter permease subunit [Kyrpidia sp.]|uniref:DHA2 family efflux MFS transporter permease subunit n=1 Tax=Kyrpidia sp. TaxID=2073077 RepID=UPI00258B7C18|nr:DHA2 family efflux MFS transporter permease subunit [Kyrpidia sp.]MCL6577122.1 DHA2 family efflux MFS transporter permease subunit [Kyrpidia sp.]